MTAATNIIALQGLNGTDKKRAVQLSSPNRDDIKPKNKKTKIDTPGNSATPSHDTTIPQYHDIIAPTSVHGLFDNFEDPTIATRAKPVEQMRCNVAKRLKSTYTLWSMRNGTTVKNGMTKSDVKKVFDKLLRTKSPQS